MENNYAFLKTCEQYGISHKLSQIITDRETFATYTFTTPNGTWEHTEPATDSSSRGWSTNAYKLRQASIFINQLILELEDRNAGDLHLIFESDQQFVEVANNALAHARQ